MNANNPLMTKINELDKRVTELENNYGQLKESTENNSESITSQETEVKTLKNVITNQQLYLDRIWQKT